MVTPRSRYPRVLSQRFPGNTPPAMVELRRGLLSWPQEPTHTLVRRSRWLKTAHCSGMRTSASCAVSDVEGRHRLCVVTVIDALMTAGAETVATRVALGLDQDRFESIICSTRPSSRQHVKAARAGGVEVLELRRRSKLDIWRWRPFVQLLRSGRVDVVHAHKFGSNLWTALLKPRGPLPILLAHEHSWS